MAITSSIRPLEDGQFEGAVVRLTVLQLRIIKQLAAGATYREIAAELQVSLATIAFHATGLQRRLRVANNAALVALALTRGLLDNGAWPPQLSGQTDLEPAHPGP